MTIALRAARRQGPRRHVAPPRWPAGQMGRPKVDLEDRNALERALDDPPMVAGNQEAHVDSPTS